MKPAAFGYARPASLTEAMRLLAEPGAKVLAGGQSLGPMLNLRVVEPELLVDVTAIPELIEAGHEAGDLVLGACLTHADIEDGRVPDLASGILRRIASGIAYRAVRNRGTLGGSLAHGDPSADWVVLLAALGARVAIAGPSGTRHLAVTDLVIGALETALGPGEIVTAIRIPAGSGAVRFGFVKACRKAGEYAHAMAAVAQDHADAPVRAVLGALPGRPLVIADLENTMAVASRSADPSPLRGGRTRPQAEPGGDPTAVAPLIDPHPVPPLRFGSALPARGREGASNAIDHLLRESGVADRASRHIHATVLGRALAQAGAA